MKRHSQPQRRAIALVVVLSVIVILSLIVVSLTVAMRMERQAAYYFSERSRADFMAKEGVEMVKIILGDSLGDSTRPAVSMPGALMVFSGSTWTNIPLSSGPAAAAGSGVLAAPDLNRPNKSGDNQMQIDPQGGPMFIPWVYVYENGDRSTNTSPTISSNNPIIGRYAFWADDESTRINLNTAWKPQSEAGSPQNTNTLAHPSQIALRALSEEITASETEAIASDTKIQPLQSLAEIIRIAPALGSNISSNRFFATHYNHSPELNPWGEPKIVLTTQLANLPLGFTAIPNYTNYFLDILRTPNSDPGSGTIAATIDFGKLDARMKTLVGYLSRSDWPLFPGQSFAMKFKPSGTNRIAQIALDIIEYVRAAESTNQAIPMIRIRFDGSNYISGGTETNAFLGTTRSPVLTEIGIWVSETTNSAGYYEGQLKAEVYLPPHYGLSSFTMTGRKIQVQLAGGSGSTGPNRGGSGTVLNRIIAAGEVSGDPMTPGSYALVTTPIFNLQEAVTNTNGTYDPFGTNNLRARVIFDTSGAIWEQGNGTGSPIPYALAPVPRPTVNDPTLVTTEVDDPRINKTLLDWKMKSAGSGNTFGLPNSIWKSAAAVSPQQDMDGGTYSDHSLTMPPPKGQPGNLRGVVSSVAELGRISSGVETSTNSGVPWRTLRMQPTSGTDTNIPDTALLDLFTVPMSTNDSAIYRPLTNSLAGRINLNTLVTPFSTNSKRQPLDAFVAGATGINASNVIPSIMAHELASGGRSFGSTNAFKFRGELAEIKGIADAGESTEANLLPLANLATVRGGTFRVFCVGQSIKQTPTGTLVPTASKSVETLLESSSDAGAVRFRSVSWRENPY